MNEFNVNVSKSRLSVGYTQEVNSLAYALSQYNQKEWDTSDYVLLDGPPYANGPAHLGHVLNKVFKDLVLKSQRAQGRSTQYQPGWDCHGLPLELAVEKKHGKESVLSLKKHCKNLALRSVVRQRKDFRALGVQADWSSPYLTMSDELKKASWLSLEKLVEKDLLEVKQYPVHYCPACHSSLAEAELEYALLPKDNLWFKVKLAARNFALVWTTTPWTLPMNQGLALNENLSYWGVETEEGTLWVQAESSFAQKLLLTYSQYATKTGKQLLEQGFKPENPLTGAATVLVSADFVTEDATGFVHLAPAHGPEDFDVLTLKHGVAPLHLLDKFGVYSDSLPECLAHLRGVKAAKSTSVVLDLLKEVGMFFEYSCKDEEQAVCWRHGCKTYYNATFQAFLKLDAVYGRVSQLLNASNVNPLHSQRLLKMAQGRSSWCLSRQRHWGTEMNLVLKKDTFELKKHRTLQALQTLADQKEFLLENDEVLFTDVLDVWFDSGNLVNAHLFANPEYAVDLVLEGKDQYRGWFQSLLWLTVAVHDKLPFKDVFCHGFVLNEDRDKFSKSKGNAKSVDFYVKEYGPDVLRLWVASQEQNSDCVFSKTKLEELKKYYSRFRLTLRFLTSNTYELNEFFDEEVKNSFESSTFSDYSRFVLNLAQDLNEELYQLYNKYAFKECVDKLYAFLDKVLSSNYFEWAKPYLYLKNKSSMKRKEVQYALHLLEQQVYSWFKVFTPFVAEEFYKDKYGSDASVFNQTEPKSEKYLVQLNWNRVFGFKPAISKVVEEAQAQKSLKAKLQASLQLHLEREEDEKLLLAVDQFVGLKELFGVSAVSYSTTPEQSFAVTLSNLSNCEDHEKCPRCWQYFPKAYFGTNLCNECVQA